MIHGHVSATEINFCDLPGRHEAIKNETNPQSGLFADQKRHLQIECINHDDGSSRLGHQVKSRKASDQEGGFRDYQIGRFLINLVFYALFQLVSNSLDQMFEAATDDCEVQVRVCYALDRVHFTIDQIDTKQRKLPQITIYEMNRHYLCL